MAITQDRWINKVLGGTRYVISEKLGEGGMGSVYLAEDRKLKTWVVLKTPHPSMLRDSEFVARFKLEVQSLVTLSHPQIVKVIDVDQHGDVPFVVLQYLPGGSLESRLYPATSLVPQPQSVFQVCTWLKPMAAALDYIHSRGYIHRDIKPANILFDETEHPYLTDFGIAKVLVEVEAPPAQRLTATGMILGTAEYMAPELLQGKPFDHRVDQYALAVTVFEALSGTRPYDGNTPAAIALAQVQQPVPNLHERVAEMPAELSRVLTRALSRSPEDRFSSCSEFAAALHGSKSSGPRGTRQAPTLTNSQPAISTERVRVKTRLASGRWRPSVVVCLILLAGALAWAARIFQSLPPSGSNLDLSKPDILSSDRNPTDFPESPATKKPTRPERPEFSAGAGSSIRSPDSPPQPTLQLAPLAGVTILEGEKWTLKANAIPVGLTLQQLRFTWGVEPPMGCEIDEVTGIISWTPTEAQGPGRYPLSVVVSSRDDPLLKDKQDFDISVQEVNQPPIIDPIADQSVVEDSNFQFAVKALDPDHPTSELRFALQKKPPIGASINPTTGLIEWKAQAAELGNEYLFRVDVSETDNPKSTSFREFKVRIRRLTRYDVLLVENKPRIQWKAKTDSTGPELGQEIQLELKNLTWRPICISGFRGDDGTNRYASIWLRDSIPWAAYYDQDRVTRQSVYDNWPANMSVIWNSFSQDRSQVILREDKAPLGVEVRDYRTREDLVAHFEKVRTDGYQPVALWQQGRDAYGFHVVRKQLGSIYDVGLSEKDLLSRLSKLPAGYHPSSIDGFGPNQGRMYSFVAIQDGTNPKWKVHPGLKPKEFEQALIEAERQGMRPLVIDVE